MPIYTYRREDGTTFDIRQKFSDDPLETDPETGQKVTRLIQAPGIVFKGSGFYVNDSKASKANLHANGSAEASTDGGEKSTKSDAPSESSSSTSGSQAEAKAS